MLREEEIVFALKEEIGTPHLFTGRKREIECLLQWTEGVKKEANQSLAFLARRKKGKTALVQRFYNILFSLNDPFIIPIYYKIKEEDKSQIKLADELYNNLLCQYAAFKTRDTSFMNDLLPYEELQEVFKDDKVLTKDIRNMTTYLETNKEDKAWHYAAYAAERISIKKNERIIQILDEFQYLNKHVYIIEQGIEKYLPLCGTYHHVGASKIAPIIVTGSYISWLLSIINRMTGRYKSIILKDLPLEEAIQAVYAYAKVYNSPITEETAAYIATVTDGDAFYISALFRSTYPSKDLTSMDTIDEIILHETRVTAKEQGEIAALWFEYLYDTTLKINDKYEKKIVLYLAKQGDKEVTRKQIQEDLNIDMTEGELEKKLDTFIQADILSYGKTRYDYRGLGDKFFDIVYRGMYQKEIDQLTIEEIKEDIREELLIYRGKANYYKGIMTEYAVINRFLFAILKGESLKDLVYTYIEGYELTELESAGKRRINLDQTQYIEIDIYLQSKAKDGNDFVVEVKNMDTPIHRNIINRFIDTKKVLSQILSVNTGYIFYSKKPLQEDLVTLLKEHNIMAMYGPQRSS